jgi:hypothetical protein
VQRGEKSLPDTFQKIANFRKEHSYTGNRPHMPDDDSTTRQIVIKALLASGFPFQTALAEVAQQVPHCKLVAEEFPWRDDTGTDRFLDLIVVKYDIIVTIECKKTQKEIFTFLQSTAVLEKDEMRSRCLYLQQIPDATKRLELFCSEWQIKPRSQESAFCVVSTSDSGKDQRMLEKDAQFLIRATDAFGRYVKEKRKPELEWDQVIVPLIVTNAKLFVAKYNPGDVSLETGQLPKPPTPPQPDISPIEWVRFRKAFTSSEKDRGHRTVFVVAANSLQKFLHNLETISSSPRQGKVLVA